MVNTKKEDYWYNKYKELDQKFIELQILGEKLVKENDDRVKQVVSEKNNLEREKDLEIAQLKGKLARLELVSKFDDYLEEYADLMHKRWAINVQGFREGKTTRDIQIAEVALGKETITFFTEIDSLPAKTDFCSEEDYFSLLEKYLEAVKDIRKTCHKLEEYKGKFPAIRVLAHVEEKLVKLKEEKRDLEVI